MRALFLTGLLILLAACGQKPGHFSPVAVEKNIPLDAQNVGVVVFAGDVMPQNDTIALDIGVPNIVFNREGALTEPADGSVLVPKESAAEWEGQDTPVRFGVGSWLLGSGEAVAVRPGRYALSEVNAPFREVGNKVTIMRLTARTDWRDTERMEDLGFEVKAGEVVYVGAHFFTVPESWRSDLRYTGSFTTYVRNGKDLTDEEILRLAREVSKDIAPSAIRRDILHFKNGSWPN